MNWNFIFFINSIILGAGLAMDAFSVSVANALGSDNLRIKRMCFIAGVYGFFQFLMPMLGWICVRTIVGYFAEFSRFVPWISLLLLCYIGIKMIFESFAKVPEKIEEKNSLTFWVLIFQGIATSLDAFSVGFATADLDFCMALISSVIICIVTFVICMIGLIIGKKIGSWIGTKSSLAGGIILCAIGIEIFVKGVAG